MGVDIDEAGGQDAPLCVDGFHRGLAFQFTDRDDPPVADCHIRSPPQRPRPIDDLRILDQQIADSVDLDWDEVQLGEREDDLPLRRPGRMPVWAWGGMIVAILLVLVFLVSLLFSIL